jgi:hypothetical protein
MAVAGVTDVGESGRGFGAPTTKRIAPGRAVSEDLLEALP